MCPISCLEDDQVRKSSLFESRYLDIDIYFLLHFPDALLELHNIYRINVIQLGQLSVIPPGLVLEAGGTST